MTKTELIDAIATGVDGLTKAKAEQALNVTLKGLLRRGKALCTMCVLQCSTRRWDAETESSPYGENVAPARLCAWPPVTN